MSEAEEYEDMISELKSEQEGIDDEEFHPLSLPLPRSRPVEIGRLCNRMGRGRGGHIYK